MAEKAHESHRKAPTGVERRSPRTSEDRRGPGPQWAAPAVGGLAGRASWALQLQRQLGNRAVGRLLGSGQPGGGGQRTTAEERARAGQTGDGSELRGLLDAQQGRGQGIPDDARQDLEAGVGAPLEGVRVHTDSAAAGLAAQLGARAFTAGQDIYFAQGAYDPASSTGYGLLAHEVAHTLQQPPAGSAAAASGPLTVDPAAAPAERQAEQVADRLSARRQLAGPGQAAPSPAVRRGPVGSTGSIRRQADPSINQSLPEVNQSLPEVNQSFPEEPAPEVNQSFPEEPAPSTSPAEPAAEEEVLRSGEAEKLEQIRELAHDWWVGPLAEGKIRDLWLSFGDRLPQIAGDNMWLWLLCLEGGARLHDLPQVTNLQDQFVDDIKQTVSGYLVLNRQVVLDEMQRLGLPTAENTPMPAPTELQAEQTRELRAAATSLANLQTAQALARQTYVGYQARTIDHPTVGSMTVYDPVTFDPYAPPPIKGGLGEGFFDYIGMPGLRVPIKSYEELKPQYDEASDTINGLLVRYPALFAFTREPSSASTAAVTAGFAATESPQQALAQLAIALRQVLQDIKATQAKLDSGDLDPLDLTPIHEQLFAGQRGKSGVDWTQTLPRWAAAEEVGDHQFYQALKSLGLQSAAAALFLLAPFTGGASLLLMVGGLAVTGAKFYFSQQQYETFAQAARTGVTPGTAPVTPQQVEAAEQIRNADAIALALAALVVGAAVAAKLIAASRGPVQVPPKVLPPRDARAFGKELGAEIKSMPGGRRAAIVTRVNAAGFSQQEAAAATEAASVEAFGRANTHHLPNGNLVVAGVAPGQNQPIFVIKPDGTIFPARATVDLVPANFTNPLRITNLVPE